MSEEEVPWEGLGSSAKGWNFIGLLFILKIFADFASNSVKIADHHCKMDTVVESTLDLEPEDLGLSSGSGIY